MSIRYLIGIDEAGRGPLAGPVAVGAVLWHLDIGCPSDFDCLPLRDSKKLSERQREMIYQRAEILQQEQKLDFAVALVSQQVIDRWGITTAIRRGIRACLKHLLSNNIASDQVQILLDGGLRAPELFAHQTTIIRGDETEQIISLASIVAKVSRDRRMVKLARRYPAYGFQRHKGYGTAAHYRAIARHGLCLIHRRSFIT